MSYLVGAGLTLVVLLGCLPLLNHSGETPPDPCDAPTPPPAPHRDPNGSCGTRILKNSALCE